MAEAPSAVGQKRRACVSCTTGKSKCTPFSSGKCERCHRLGKECLYDNISLARRRPRTNLRLQTLERKIEELVAHQSSRPNDSVPQAKAVSAELSMQAASNSTSSGAFARQKFVETPGSSVNAAISSPSTSGTNSTSNSENNADVVDRGLVALEYAHILFDRFRGRAAEQFPFVIVPPYTTLDQIRRDTPFLFLTTIATMSFDNPDLQRRLGEEIRTKIFRRLLLGYERSLELLQGLLIYAAWYFFFYRREHQQVSLISQLCVMLVQDMGIDKAVNRRGDQDTCGSREEQKPSSSHSNAQTRAFLGTFVLSCSVATNLRRRNAMAYTKYTEQCCQTLAIAKEYSTDELIPHLVRIQKLARRVFDAFSYDDVNNAEFQGEFITALTTDAFLRDFDSLQLLLPPMLQQSALLSLEYDILSLLIHEVALHDRFWEDPKSLSAVSEINTLSSVRSKMLWSSLQSCNSLARTFLSYQDSDVFFLTAFAFSKLCYVMVTFAKLVQLELSLASKDNSRTTEPQRQHWINVVKEAEFPYLAVKVMEKFSNLATDFVGTDGERDAMWNLSSMVRIMVSGYEKQAGQLQRATLSSEVSTRELEGAQDRNDRATGPNSFHSQQADDPEENVPFGAPFLEQSSDFQWDRLDNIAWDQILDGFSIVP